MKIEELYIFEDIHTHVKAGQKSICSVMPKDAIALCKSKEYQPFSIELHPWYASRRLLQEFLDACEICRDDARFVAIGECGLDKGEKGKENGFDIQEECFRHALRKAKELQKPVIIHCVKAWDELHKLIKAQYPLPLTHYPPIIIHGFRKNAIFAQQLIQQGYYISLGKKYNPEIPKIIPADKIFHETDNIFEK